MLRCTGQRSEGEIEFAVQECNFPAAHFLDSRALVVTYFFRTIGRAPSVRFGSPQLDFLVTQAICSSRISFNSSLFCQGVAHQCGSRHCFNEKYGTL